MNDNMLVHQVWQKSGPWTHKLSFSFYTSLKSYIAFGIPGIAILRHDIIPEYNITVNYIIFIFCTIILNQIKIVPNMQLNDQLQNKKDF